ncbi:membrane protein insertion efficiency factor YidD [Patescibacteria group bacterium]|nr:membrane protein insertion efficiency factor YidD [Patescibacteria group bacterium]
MRLILIFSPKFWIVQIIRFYQKTISRDHGFLRFLSPNGFGVCKFRPTCSEYAIQAIEKYGLIKGIGKAGWRIMRCHPWSSGGWDEP